MRKGTNTRTPLNSLRSSQGGISTLLRSGKRNVSHQAEQQQGPRISWVPRHAHLYLTIVPYDARHSSMEGPFQSPHAAHTLLRLLRTMPRTRRYQVSTRKWKFPSRGAWFPMTTTPAECREDAGGSLAKHGNGLLPLPGIPDKKV